ncbi:MAG: phage nozzle protein, partial [Planctomycetota bacterium]
NEFDADTMPHTLTYQGGTTFWFQPGTWDDRTKGDAVSAPEPTFVGREIKDILLHKSRLTVLADENVMGTESHNYFNFWPTTATTIVDSDPIDVSAGGNEVNLLEFAVPFQRNLTVFSPTGGTQQELVGSDVEDLTIKNARIEERTHYQMAPVRPVSAGKNLYFAVERNEWSALHEYGMDGLDRAFTEDAAAHVPSFVPKNINRISGSSAENVIALSTTEADFDHRLYIYRFWYIGDQKVQSSWSYWEFDSAAKVDDHFWIDSTLYIVLERADGPHLEKIDFRETESLDYDGNGIGYLVHLDKHAVVTLAYSAVGDYSSYSCGFDPTDIANEEDYGEWVLVKVRGGLSLEWPEGEIGEVIVPTVDATTTNGSLRFEGDLTGGSYILGMRYRSKYQVSEVVIDEGSDERPRPLLSGHILLKRWRVLYKDTMDFDVEVTFTDGTDIYTYSFSQDQVGDIDAEPLPVSGEYAFPVGARSEHAEITFTSESPGPFTFTAMEWEARLFSRARRA